MSETKDSISPLAGFQRKKDFGESTKVLGVFIAPYLSALNRESGRLGVGGEFGDA